MFNYFLHTDNFINADYYKIGKSLEHFSNLTINNVGDEHDHFYQEDGLMDSIHKSGLKMMEIFHDKIPQEHFRIMVLPILMGKLQMCPVMPSDIAQVNASYPEQKNAYWGACFGNKTFYQLCRVNDYHAFRNFYVNHVEPDFLWKFRSLIFKSIVLCDDVKSQVAIVGGGNVFDNIVSKLKKLDQYAMAWDSGNFEIKKLASYVKASNEDKETMKIPTLAKLRRFKINSTIGYQTCSYHVKDGHLRFHFYPDNLSRIIYVAYIGKHLKTKKYRK